MMKKRVVSTAMVLLLAGILACAGSLALDVANASRVAAGGVRMVVKSMAQTEFFPRERDSVCLLFIASLPPEAGTRRKTASLTLVRLTRQGDMVKCLSVPLEMLTSYDGANDGGFRGQESLGAALGLGGPELLAGEVEKLVGVPVDYWVHMRLEKAAGAFGTLGALEVTLPMAVTSSGLSVPAGKAVCLDGPQVVEMMRRPCAGDESCIALTQALLRSFFYGKLKRLEIAQLMSFVAPLGACVEKNMDDNRMLDLMLHVRKGVQAFDVRAFEGRTLTVKGRPFLGRSADKAAEARSWLTSIPGRIRIVVQNCNGINGDGQKASKALEKAGLSISSTCNGTRCDVAGIKVLLPRPAGAHEARNVEEQGTRIVEILSSDRSLASYRPVRVAEGFTSDTIHVLVGRPKTEVGAAK